MAGVEINQLRKSFDRTEIIKGVDLNIQTGEFVVFVGPSGCGKSTLLRLIAGLEEASSGVIKIGSADVTRKAACDRGVSMVFQSYALYPHMTVEQNIGFGLRMNGVSRDVVKNKTMEVAKVLQLDALLKRKPKQLSGGQKQRVAIGRAIIRDPKVYLFDEPLSNLDAELRVEMRLQINRLHKSMPESTMIYVTHDQVEAMTMADKIVVLKDGFIEQVGSPIDLYNNPANQFVAGFIGSPKMNFLEVTLEKSAAKRSRLKLKDGSIIEVPIDTEGCDAGSDLILGYRPEDVTISPHVGKHNLTIDVAEHLGGTTFVYGSFAGLKTFVLEAKGFHHIKTGENLPFDLDVDKVHLFKKNGESLRGTLSQC